MATAAISFSANASDQETSQLTATTNGMVRVRLSARAFGSRAWVEYEANSVVTRDYFDGLFYASGAVQDSDGIKFGANTPGGAITGVLEVL